MSLQAQQQRLTAYCQAFELDLIEVIEDAGMSAKDLGRPGLQRALTLLGEGKADALLIGKLDRLTRSVKDLALLLEGHFHDGKTGLISVAENIDTTSAAGRLVLNVLVSVGQWEREAIGERTRDALHHLRKSGVRLGQPGLGYRFSEETDDRGRRLVVPVGAEVAALNRILELRGEGLTIRAIAHTLETEGHRTKRGQTRWSPASVHRVLKRGGA